METILLTLSPLVVALITSWLKPSKTTPILGFRKTAVRFGVAVLSFGAVVGSAFLSGQEVDVTSISTFAETLLTFLGATGAYFLAKKNSA